MGVIQHFLDQRRLIDSNGIADGGTLGFYLAGTTTPTTIYSDAALSTPMTNPVVVGAGAVVPTIYLDSTISYKRVITYPDGSTDISDPYIPTNENVPVTLEQFGGIGDGTTDNTAAFDAFRAYHATVTAADPDVWVTLSFGAGKAYASKDPAWPCGLDRLIVEGNGSTFENIIGSGESAFFVDKAPLYTGSLAYCDSAGPAALADKGVTENYTDWDYINAASAGATSVTCTTAGDAANYAAGDWVIVAQGVGFLGGSPPSPHQFQFLEVASVNAGTGVVTFATGATLNAAYSATLPVDNALFRTGYWPARAIIFKCLDVWNVRQVYRNWTVLSSAAEPLSGAYFMGRSIVLENVTAPGVTLTQYANVSAKSCLFYNAHAYEPIDKLGERALFTDCAFNGEGGAGGDGGCGMVLAQSCVFNTSHGAWRNASYDNCTFNGALFAAASDSLSFTRCVTNGTVTMSQSNTITVDGTTITYAAGVITVPLASAAANQAFLTRVKIGRSIWGVGSGVGEWTGIWGIITSFTISGANLLIGVNVVNRVAPGAPVPNGTILNITPIEQYFGANNSGEASPVTIAGAQTALPNGDTQTRLGNDLRVTFAVESGGNIEEYLWFCRGYFEELRITVERAYTGVTHATLFLNFYDYSPTFNSANVSIDLKTVGTRVITPSGTSGALGADTVNALKFFLSRVAVNASVTAVGATATLAEATNLLPIVTLELKVRDHTLHNALVRT
jgi:hypothetical protein